MSDSDQTPRKSTSASATGAAARPASNAVATLPAPKVSTSRLIGTVIDAAAPAPAEAIANPSLSELTPLLAASVTTFLSKLAAQGIQTLADVRHAGGLARFTDPADAATARLIEAHADLARISSDISANAALIAGGYDNTLKIAKASRSSFITTAAPALGDIGAARVQVAAVSLYRALDQVLTATRVDAASRIKSGLPPAIDEVLADAERQLCDCCDCQAAQSPAAYLADLLSYITQHLQNRRKLITLDYLVENFYQPFGDLPTDCEAVDQPVRQVRLCVEVLRRYIAATTTATPDALAAALAAAEVPYLYAVYNALLAEVGTTYQELRVARRADATTLDRACRAARIDDRSLRIGEARPARQARARFPCDDAIRAHRSASRDTVPARRALARAPLRNCRHDPQPAIGRCDPQRHDAADHSVELQRRRMGQEHLAGRQALHYPRECRARPVPSLALHGSPAWPSFSRGVR